MSDDVLDAPPQPTPEQLEALAAHEDRQLALAVDAIHMTAVSISRVINLPVEGVSRLCISAGCRSLDKLMERYEDARHNPERAAELARLQRAILATAEDLHAALAEGSKMAEQLRAMIGADGRPQ